MALRDTCSAIGSSDTVAGTAIIGGAAEENDSWMGVEFTLEIEGIVRSAIKKRHSVTRATMKGGVKNTHKFHFYYSQHPYF